jgi:hypothetical protein
MTEASRWEYEELSKVKFDHIQSKRPVLKLAGLAARKEKRLRSLDNGPLHVYI